MEKVFKVLNPTGLHARPASLLVQKAATFPCNILIAKGDKQVNGKSIMGIMSLAVQQGDQIKVICNGEQEAAALTAIGELLEKVYE